MIGKFKIGDSAIHGKGLIATGIIKRGETAVAFHKIASTGNPDKDYRPTVVGKTVNHSEAANLGVLITGNQVQFVAKAMIVPGEELTVDYRTIPWKGKREFAEGLDDLGVSKKWYDVLNTARHKEYEDALLQAFKDHFNPQHPLLGGKKEIKITGKLFVYHVVIDLFDKSGEPIFTRPFEVNVVKRVGKATWLPGGSLFIRDDLGDKGLGQAIMDSVIKTLSLVQENKEMVVNSERVGRYAWSRMKGAKFLDADKDRVKSKFLTWKKEIGYTGPDPESPDEFPKEFLLSAHSPKMITYIVPLSEGTLNEGFILSDDTTFVDFDKWVKGEKNALFVVGLSGGGKTTLGRQLARKYHAKLIETDDFWHEFLKAHEYAGDPAALTQEEKDKFYAQHLKYIAQKIKDVVRGGRKCVVEGIHAINPYMGLVSFVARQPLVVTGTSFLLSSYRRMKRDPKWYDTYGGFFGYLKDTVEVNNFFRKAIKVLMTKVKARKDAVVTMGNEPLGFDPEEARRVRAPSARKQSAAQSKVEGAEKGHLVSEGALDAFDGQLTEEEQIKRLIVKTDSYKYYDWVVGDTNILFIVGLSGSGKSTFARALRSKFSCKLIDLDDVLQKGEHLNKAELEDLKSQDVHRWARGFYHFIRRMGTRRIIIEGVHILDLPTAVLQKLRDCAFLVPKVSFIRSTLRAQVRNMRSEDDPAKLRDLIPLVRMNLDLRRRLVELRRVLGEPEGTKDVADTGLHRPASNG